MSTEDLADSIKRLRELSKCTEAMTEQSIFKSVRQLNMHYEQGSNDIITLSDGVLSAIQTINQLVDLVARLHAQLNYWLPEHVLNPSYADQENELRLMAFRDADKTLIKAAPIAELKGTIWPS